MINRRMFIAGAVSVLTAPYILRNPAIAQTPRVRRDLSTLGNSDPFFSKYADAVSKLHKLPATDQRSWRNQALIHLNFCPHSVDGLAEDFVHWHRHYIANFEAICAQMIGDPGFALPYWNWTADRGRIPDPFYDTNELNVTFWKDPSNASSAHWGSAVSTVGTRNLMKGKGLLDTGGGGAFTKKAIDDIQGLPSFDLYSKRLEGSPHGVAHNVTGGDNGHMVDGMSPLDPIFWLHHCNVDRLWAQWQAAHSNGTPPASGTYSGQFVDAAGKPVTSATSANALETSTFGYSYDVLVAASTSPRPAVKRSSPSSGGKAQPAASLGADRTKKIAPVRTETRFTVGLTGLDATLSRFRTIWMNDSAGAPTPAAEVGRILASFKDVTGPENLAPSVVNVFINCPYLSPETPYEDRHFAGTFSLFGPSHHGRDYLVDITEPVRSLLADGKIASDSINVQLMPQPVEKLGLDTKLSVGGVEILSV